MDIKELYEIIGMKEAAIRQLAKRIYELQRENEELKKGKDK